MKKKKLIIITMVAVSLLVISLLAAVLAKFVNTKIIQDSIVSGNLVFVSDYLTDDATAPQYIVYGDSVTFKIKNFDTLNIATEEITYTVSGATVLPAGGTLVKSTESANTHTLTGTAGQSYTVTATTSTPYSGYSISATFVFKEATMGYYELRDEDTAVVLDIYTGAGGAGTYTVNYGGLFPDTTNSLMAAWNGGTGTAVLTDDSHYELVFFKPDYAQAYTPVLNGSLSSKIVTIQ